MSQYTYYTTVGLPGAATHSCQGVPWSALGVDGDRAISTNGSRYIKLDGAWAIDPEGSLEWVQSD